MSQNKKTTITVVLASSLLLAGCGLFGDEEKVGSQIDPPQDVSIVNDLDTDETDVNNEEMDDEEVSNQVSQRELYLLDRNGFVVSQTLALPKSDSPAKQALQYLVAGGPVEDLLPNGFRAVIPAGTEVDVNLLSNGTIVADFSSEFAEYLPEDELAILQAITWTLTQFDSVENVELRVNGHKQDVMPVNKTPITKGLSRANGINLEHDAIDIMNTRPVTLYYIGENNNGDTYYVPVTKRIKAENANNYEAIIDELINGPSSTSGLLSGFTNDVELLSEPKYENGLLTLDFNENIVGWSDNTISKEVIDTIVLTLTEQPGVDSVAITVNGEKDLMASDGTSLAEPVSRPEKVNTGRF
ncbi:MULTISPECIES: GerMN domain-containing protein [Sutcliffiella]|uniref:Sporulation protein n=1 Tax=Sutcliffiella cohnii TaxID=33932 RepID=A0A223KTJ8_9BACI|nr:MULTISPECIES: GerMN domain-containing protein [Sutcliffiella]AST92776.1 sporulation protein [Sutcliffiella cohnii]WBL14028.1 GerMN domain-containing protein [Sutcliffiella sp. NC1]